MRKKFILPPFPKPSKWLLPSLIPLLFMLLLFASGVVHAADTSTPAPMPQVQGIDAMAGVTTTGLLDAATSTRSDAEAMSGHWALRQIFGSVADNPLSPSADAQNGTVLSAVFYVLNLSLLAVAVIFVTYKVVSAAVATGQDGEFLGKSQGKTWTPIRNILGVVSLAPIFGGWSLAQLVAIWFAMLGVGAGNIAWNASIDFLARGGQLIQQAPPVPRQELAEKLFRIHVCRASMYYSINEARAQSVGIPELQKIYDPSPFANPSIPTAGGRVSYGKDGACGVVRLPTFAETRDINVTVMDRFTNLPETLRAKMELSRQTVQIVGKNFEAMNSEIAALAETFVLNLANPDRELGAQLNEADPLSRAKLLGYDPRKLLQIEATFNDSNVRGVRGIITTTNDEFQTISTALKTHAKDEGFLTAGAFFSSVARMGNTIREATNIAISVEQEATGPEESTFKPNGELYTQAVGVMQVFSQQAEAVKTEDSKTGDKVQQAVATVAKKAFCSNSLDGSISVGQCVLNGLIPDGYRERNILLVLKDSGDTMAAAGLAGTFINASVFESAKSALSIVPWSEKLTKPLIAALTEAQNLLALLFKLSLLFGLMLSIYLPLVPVIHWIAAIISWLGKVVEGVVNASLIGFAHLDSDNDGIGEKTRPGYLTFLSLLIHPILLVIGLISAVVVMQVVGALFLYLFPLAIADAQAESMTGLFSIVGFLAIFALFSVTIVSNSCDLIHVIPDGAMRWMGSAASESIGRNTAAVFAGGTTGAAGAAESVAPSSTLSSVKGINVAGKPKPAGKQVSLYTGV